MKSQETASQRIFLCKYGVVLFACVIALPSAGTAALAEVDYFNLSPEQLLDTKILSVSKRSESVADAPAAIYVVTGEDIRRSGVTTIPDALRMIPGVNVARSDSNSWAISIRGFNSVLSNKLLVLLDGRTIYNPVFGGVMWEAHDLMLEDIERIEVVRGPGGALWGANAVNGVINILTKHTRDTQGNLVSVVAGNEERGAINARHGGSLGSDGTYRIYAKAFDRDSSVKPSGNEAYDAWDGARVGFRADWSDEFTLQGDAYKTSEEQYRYDYSLVPPNMPIAEQNIVYEGVNLLGRWTKKFDEDAQLSVQTYVDWARRDEPFNFIDDRTIYDVETQYNFAPIGAHEFVAGAGVRYLRDNKIGNNNVSFSPQRRHDFIYNGFIQDKVTLVQDAIFLTLGTKFEHNEFSGTENQPNIRLHWQAPHDQTVWASASRAVRTPTPLEEDLTSTVGAGPGVRVAFVPNDDAKAEELTAYEIGYRNQITPAFSVDLSTFYNDYDKLQTFTVGLPFIVNNGRDPVHLFIPVKFTNDMTGRSRGAEAAFNWTINANMKMAFDYSYLHLTVRALNPSQEGAETLYPTHQVGTQLFWNFSDNWTFDTSVAYVDDLPGAKVENYVRMDLNLGLKVTEHLRLNLVGQNLLDNQHREFSTPTDLNVAEIERSIFGKVTWDF